MVYQVHFFNTFLTRLRKVTFCCFGQVIEIWTSFPNWDKFSKFEKFSKFHIQFENFQNVDNDNVDHHFGLWKKDKYVLVIGSVNCISGSWFYFLLLKSKKPER